MDREVVDLARLEVTGLATDRERGGDVLVFDPTRVPEGILLPDDPILHARPGRTASRSLAGPGLRADHRIRW